MVEQRQWNSQTSDGGTVEHLTVEQWNLMEQRRWNSKISDGWTVELVMVEQ